MNSKVARHGGNIAEEASKLGINAKELLDASASLVPFPLSDSLQKSMQQALTSNCLESYPDCSYKALKKVISNWHQIEPEMVLPGNGAAELFTWAAKDASEHGLSGLPVPGFLDYERALNCWNANYIHLPLPLQWTTKGPENFPIQSNTNVIWITNPHNPTGQLWSRKSLEVILNNYSLVICDEAFLPMVPNGEKESLIPLVKKYKNLIVIRSLTKIFALAGLRLGYAVSLPERLYKWSQVRDPWPVNGLAVEAGINLIKDSDNLNIWINAIHKWVESEGDWFYSKLKLIPDLEPHLSSVNFHLINSRTSLVPLREKLAQRKILTRDCRSFRSLDGSWLRISLQSHQNNQLIINSIQEILK